MKYFLLIVLLALNPISDLDKIATINKHKKEAREAYNNGEFEKALSHYAFLVDSMKVEEPEVLLNYGNTLYQLSDTTRAIERFASLYDSNDKQVRSVANQQLGIIHNKMLKEPKAALEYFKQALKDDPSNEDARYNYEMLKKAMKEQEQQQDQQDQEQNKDQQNDQQEKQDQEQQQQDQQNDQQQQDQQEQQEKEEQSEQKKEGEEGEENEDKEQQDQEQSKDKPGEEKEQKDQQQQEGEPDEQDDQQNEDQQNSVAEKLKDMKISEEKARMILEAMKNNEIQYFQQNKRKPTKKKDSSKPDW